MHLRVSLRVCVWCLGIYYSKINRITGGLLFPTHKKWILLSHLGLPSGENQTVVELKHGLNLLHALSHPLNQRKQVFESRCKVRRCSKMQCSIKKSQLKSFIEQLKWDRVASDAYANVIYFMLDLQAKLWKLDVTPNNSHCSTCVNEMRHRVTRLGAVQEMSLLNGPNPCCQLIMPLTLRPIYSSTTSTFVKREGA